MTGEVEERICPHDLRKSLSTDLAWDPSLHTVALRRMFGHAPGSDVHDLHYVLDRPDHAENRKFADRIHADIAAQLPGGLIVPTTLRPGWGSSYPSPEQLAQIEVVLLEHGWHQIGSSDADLDGPPLLDGSTVAAVLDRPESTIRRWMATAFIPSRMLAGPLGKRQWYAVLDDVEVFAAEKAAKRHIPDVAAEFGVTRHVVYRLADRLEITLPKDERTGEFLVDDVIYTMLHAELTRLQQLHERSMPLSEAVTVLGPAPVVQAWLSTGRLERDPHSDVLGRVFVTRSSVAALHGLVPARRAGVP